MPWEAH
jgi:hypothetical protein